MLNARNLKRCAEEVGVVPQGFAHAATLHQEDLFIREDLLAGEYALNQVNFLSFRNQGYRNILWMWWLIGVDVAVHWCGCSGSLVWM
jgi:hypothetical protein